jgi:secreted trypsin-like serine protease
MILLFFIIFLVRACAPNTFESELDLRLSAIKGGQIVPMDDPLFPAIVKVFADDTFCSGILIKEDVVLTAAHCLPKDYFHFRNSGIIDGFGVPRVIVRVFYSDGFMRDYLTKNIIAHEEYDPNVWDTTDTPYDMALLRLENAVDDEIAPVDIYFDKIPSSETEQFTMGYGHFTGALNVSSNNDGQLRRLNLNQGEMEDIFVKFFDPKEGPCVGDSGGPSFVMIEGTPYVTGVLSFALPDKAMSEEQRLLFVGDSGLEANWDQLYEEYPDFDECAGGEFFYSSTHKLRDFVEYYLPRL